MRAVTKIALVSLLSLGVFSGCASTINKYRPYEIGDYSGKIWEEENKYPDSLKINSELNKFTEN